MDVPFALQSTSKPLTYSLALHEHGPDYVHMFVGQEPSGECFDMIKLDTQSNHPPSLTAAGFVAALKTRRDAV